MCQRSSPPGNTGPPLGTFAKGSLLVKLRCPAGGEDCTGKATVTTANRERTKLGSARFDIPEGSTATVKVKVPRRLRALVKQLEKIRVVAGGARVTLRMNRRASGATHAPIALRVAR